MMMTRLVISVKEFGQMLQSSCPPAGWGDVLAVAHSGGADSTCLLYLLHRLVSEKRDAKQVPRELLALSVDHSLQPGSAAIAERCRRLSESLQIPHTILRIPWGQPPFPNLPAPGRPFESVARAARYRVLMEAMKASKATVLAMGHHADDHVETILMRLTRAGSNGAMPTCMRNCRRWGMGSKSDGLDWAGMSGMHRWIVRPLLGVSKERILATCELHGLSYINDPTNFQPSLTPRNYVRYFLSKDRTSHAYQDIPSPSGIALLPLKKLDYAIGRLDKIANPCKEVSRLKRLYAAASYLGQLRDSHDIQVDEHLRDFTRTSPLSTLFISSSLQNSLPTPEVRKAIILRVLRYVSPRPWGSPLSEASRRSSSLNLIDDRLWSSSIDGKKAFSAGSEVVWRPAYLREDGSIRLMLDKRNARQTNDGWLASRLPPMKKTHVPSPCVEDISGILKSNNDQEVLWDNRFLLKLRPHLLTSDILESCNAPGSVMVLPHGPWVLPKIVWRRQGSPDISLSGINLQHNDEVAPKRLGTNWIDIEWIRPLGAM